MYLIYKIISKMIFNINKSKNQDQLEKDEKRQTDSTQPKGDQKDHLQIL